MQPIQQFSNVTIGIRLTFDAWRNFYAPGASIPGSLIRMETTDSLTYVPEVRKRGAFAWQVMKSTSSSESSITVRNTTKENQFTIPIPSLISKLMGVWKQFQFLNQYTYYICKRLN